MTSLQVSGHAGGPILPPAKIHVDQLSSDVDVSGFHGREYQLHTISDRRKDETTRAFVPKPRVRDKALYLAGILPAAASMDQLDRDVLYLRAKNLSLSDLKTQYPGLDAMKLEKLQALVTKL